MFPWHVLAPFQIPWEFPSHSLVVLLAALGSKYGKLALPLRLSTCLRPEAALEGPVLLLMSTPTTPKSQVSCFPDSSCAFSEVDKQGKVLAISQVWQSSADL